MDPHPALRTGLSQRERWNPSLPLGEAAANRRVRVRPRIVPKVNSFFNAAVNRINKHIGRPGPGLRTITWIVVKAGLGGPDLFESHTFLNHVLNAVANDGEQIAIVTDIRHVAQAPMTASPITKTQGLTETVSNLRRTVGHGSCQSAAAAKMGASAVPECPEDKMGLTRL